jgi:hypothetical protein
MAITPVTPINNDSPWEPNIDPGDSNQQKAQSEYQHIYGGSGNGPAPPSGGGSDDTNYQVPVLQLDYDTAPSIIPTKQTGGSTPPAQVAPGDPLAINLGDLISAENTVLAATEVMIGAYDSMVSEALSAANSDSIWGQNVGTTMTVSGPSDQRTQNHGYKDDGSGTTPAPYQVTTGNNYDDEGAQYGQAFDQAMKGVLSEVSQVIEMIGTFTALLNNAGQAYAQTDYSSWFTTPPSVPKF